MVNRLNLSDVFYVKSRINTSTNTYDDSNNWNIVNACLVCTNCIKCKYNTIGIKSDGICLNFNYSNSVVLTKIYYNVKDQISIRRINHFRDSVPIEDDSSLGGTS